MSKKKMPDYRFYFCTFRHWLHGNDQRIYEMHEKSKMHKELDELAEKGWKVTYQVMNREERS